LIFVTGDIGLKPLIGEVDQGSIAEEAGFRTMIRSYTSGISRQRPGKPWSMP